MFSAARRCLALMLFGVGVVVALMNCSALAADSSDRLLGIFEGQCDIGEMRLPASASLLDDGSYKLVAAGNNIWFAKDDFRFVWRKASGDLTMKADIGFEGEGKDPHRKAGWMVRQSLDPDAPYADVMLHGNGLLMLQYRQKAGGPTLAVKSPIDGPATVKLERNANVFTLSVARADGDFQPAGAVSVELNDPVYVGLAACSHDADYSETFLLKNVSLDVQPIPANVQRVRESTLEVISIDSGERKAIYTARDHFEAPNWSRDGKQFFINRDKKIYTLPVTGGVPELLDVGTATGCNNDHGLSPDGRWLAISHSNQNRISLISIVPSTGGAARQVTPTGPSFWHGWSPDGKTLAYCGKRGDDGDVYTMPAEGGEETRLTTAPGLDDGPDYTADGQTIYWNSECTGAMRIWRMRADGSQQEQVTNDDAYGDWFPHPSPDGKWLVWLSFDKTVKGHPAAKDVVLRIMPLAGGKPKILATLFGGQGTINVPSWSPDSKQLAFVSYRFVLP